MIPIRTILHPTDFSEHAANAFQLACCLARDQGARVIVLHVAEQASSPSGHREALEEQLRAVQAPDATIRVEHRMEHGTADSEIVRVAQDVGCDLIIMGTEGKMGIGRNVLPGRWVGSVAGKVIRSANCPVVAVKMPEVEGQAENA